MSTKFCILLLILFIISCDSKEDRKLILNQKNTDYKINISTIGTKINSEGIAQCSKYGITTINDTNYTSYGLQLKDVLANIYSTTPKYIDKLPFDYLKDEYFDIYIENYTNERLNYDSILSLVILNIFNIEITEVDSFINGYELIVNDSKKLKKYQNECGVSSITYTAGTWVASRSRLVDITKILNQYTDIFISSRIPNQNCYSIKFKVGNDYIKINKSLKQFGLILKRTELKQTFYKIETVANNTCRSL